MSPTFDPFRSVPDQLRDITEVANMLTRENYGSTQSCILTSYALHNALLTLGEKSRVVRITAQIHPKSNGYGSVLGSEGDGTRQPKSERGMWKGHLAVLVQERWLLDATLDQVNNEVMSVKPVALELESLDPFKSTRIEVGNCDVSYHMYWYGQKGFKSAPDARPSHWRELAKTIVAIVNPATPLPHQTL